MKPSDPNAPRVVIVAGETSGDLHGAELIRSLKRKRPELVILGAGGPRMKSAGQEPLFDLTEHAVVGLWEVGKHYPKLRKLFQRLMDLVREESPEAVILIDYPGFNLRLAEALRKVFPTLKLIYYIAPQVWAWKAGRAKKMARDLDLLLCLFPFEKNWFSQHARSLPVECVGHPTLDRLRPIPEENSETIRVALLPGSRANELRKHLPILWQAAHLMSQNRPQLQFVWVAPDEKLAKLGQQILSQFPAAGLQLESYIGYQLSHVSRCKIALAASGTVSLECAMVGVPPIVFYKVNPFTYGVGKLLVKVKYLSMVNVLANQPIVTELIQSTLTPQRLAQEAIRLITDKERYEIIRKKMAQVVEALGGAGASDRAANLILARIAPSAVSSDESLSA